MSVKLVSYSKPTMAYMSEGISGDNMLDLVAYCARVSNPSNQMNNETSEKLVKYLIKHQLIKKIYICSWLVAKDSG